MNRSFGGNEIFFEKETTDDAGNTDGIGSRFFTIQNTAGRSSTLDAEGGVFYWQPGPGFIGEYRFVFVTGDQQGHKTSKIVRLIIRPKY